MIASLAITLHDPLWLLALPLPWLALRIRRRFPRNGARRNLGQLIDPALQPWVVRGRPQGSAPRWILGLVWCLLILALSGPALRQPSPQALPPAFDLAVVVDISPSMAADDLAPDRLTRLKLELRDFLRLAPPFRGALVVYSAEAYRLLPLTRDRAVLGHYIDALGHGMTRRRGSNLGQAIEVARDALTQGSARSSGLLVLTDGESFADADVEAEARRLGKAELPIYILGVGTTSGAPVPDGMGGLLQGDRGQTVISRLDQTLLRRLAQVSGGAYSDLRPDDADWHTLLNAMTAKLQPYQNDDRAWRDLPLFPYLIGVACLLLLWQGFRGPIPALCLIVTLMPMRPAAAADWIGSDTAATQGYRALKDRDWQAAIQAYRQSRSFAGLMGLGFASYRANAFEHARSAFAEALSRARNDAERAQAAYNLGTTEARLKYWKAAQASLSKAIAQQPDAPMARQNLRLVEQAMRTDHAGLRPSGTAKTTRTDPDKGEFDPERAPAKTEDPTRQDPARPFSQTARLDRALKQWGLNTEQEAGREERMRDDIGAVVRYRIAKYEAARPLLELGMPPW